MPFTIDEAFLPATLTAPPMTDQEFAAFCAQHPDLFFEMTAAGEIIVMPPSFSLTGVRNREILGQFDRWASQERHGIVADSATGVVLPMARGDRPMPRGWRRTRFGRSRPQASKAIGIFVLLL